MTWQQVHMGKRGHKWPELRSGVQQPGAGAPGRRVYVCSKLGSGAWEGKHTGDQLGADLIVLGEVPQGAGVQDQRVALGKPLIGCNPESVGDLLHQLGPLLAVLDVATLQAGLHPGLLGLQVGNSLIIRFGGGVGDIVRALGDG